MEKNAQGQIISWSIDESDLRDAHLNIFRIENQIKSLQQEVKQLEIKKQNWLDKGIGLYLTEWDIKHTETPHF
jgi:hypothetical protein